MKNLDNVKNFYRQVEFEAKFDYQSINFEQHNVFANPPQFRRITLPYLGEVELTLVAIQQPSYPNKTLSHCKIAQDEGDSGFGDGKYNYSSRVSFLVKPTPTLLGVGFTPEPNYAGSFAGLITLDCNQVVHSKSRRHPMKYFGGGKWPKKSPTEFCTQNLPKIIAAHRGRFYPAELHEYPFEDGPVLVVCKDATKIGGYTRHTTAEVALRVFHFMFENLYAEEHGNVNISGWVEANGVRWIIPAFGKNHVAID